MGIGTNNAKVAWHQRGFNDVNRGRDTDEGEQSAFERGGEEAAEAYRVGARAARRNSAKASSGSSD